jgi:hypothetical protein
MQQYVPSHWQHSRQQQHHGHDAVPHIRVEKIPNTQPHPGVRHQPSIQELLMRQTQLKRQWDQFLRTHVSKAGPTAEQKYQYMKTQETLELAISEQLQGNEIQSDEQRIMHRPTNDPNFYDQMFYSQFPNDQHVQLQQSGNPFNSQTRLQGTEGVDRRWEQKQRNQTAIDYHLFSPKFENHTDSTGYQDTWRPQLYIKKEDSIGNGRRGEERISFPSRTAPTLASRREQQPLPYVSPFQSKDQQVSNFNQTIDSLHLPDDMQRPVATRDFVKQMDNPPSNNVTAKGAPRLDNNYIVERNMNYETMLPLGSASSFENMFY